MFSLFTGEAFKPCYSREANLQVLKHNGRYIVINPSIGGWAMLEERELIKLFHPTGLDPEFGEQLYRCGLARKNGNSVYNKSDLDVNRRKMFFFEFNITRGCNLGCVYCSNEASPERITEKADKALANKLVDRIAEYYLPCNTAPSEVHLEFTGGEPLLNFPVIRSAVCRAQEWEKRLPWLKFNYTLQTNLSIPLSADHITFLKRNNFRLGVSIDGYEAIHNAQRPFASGSPSFNQVMQNVHCLRERGIPIRTACTVITSISVEHMLDIARFFLNNGFCRMVFTPMRAIGRGRRARNIVPKSEDYVTGLFQTFTNIFLPHYLQTGLMPHERHLALAFSQILQPRRRYMCCKAPCGGGSLISTTLPNEDIYPCNELPWDRAFKLGNAWEHTFEEIRDSPISKTFRARTIDTIRRCKECVLRAWCQSACTHSAVLAYGRTNEPSAFCDERKALFETALFGLIDGRFDRDAAMAISREFL